MCTVMGSYRDPRGRVSPVPKQCSPNEAQMLQVMESHRSGGYLQCPRSGDRVRFRQAEVRGAMESGRDGRLECLTTEYVMGHRWSR